MKKIYNGMKVWNTCTSVYHVQGYLFSEMLLNLGMLPACKGCCPVTWSPLSALQGYLKFPCALLGTNAGDLWGRKTTPLPPHIAPWRELFLIFHFQIWMTLWGLILSLIYLFLFLWPCCKAYGILVPCLGVEPMPLALEAQSLNHCTTREVPRSDSWITLSVKPGLSFSEATSLHNAEPCEAIRHILPFPLIGLNLQQKVCIHFLALPYKLPHVSWLKNTLIYRLTVLWAQKSEHNTQLGPLL